MSQVNPKNVKKSAMWFFVASTMFVVSLTISLLSGEPKYYMALPAILTFAIGVIQWVNYKKIRKNFK